MEAIANDDRMSRSGDIPESNFDFGEEFEECERNGFALCKEPFPEDGQVRRSVDIFVGLTITEPFTSPATVEVSIPAARWVLDVRPGVITPALGGLSFLPLICLRFHEVRVKVLDGDPESVRLVGAWTSSAARRGFFQRPSAFKLTDGKTLVITSGMAGVTEDVPEDACMLPEVPAVVAVKARRETASMGPIAKTWDPERHMQWCLRHDPLRVHDVGGGVPVDALLADSDSRGPPRMLKLKDFGATEVILQTLAASLGMRLAGECFVAGSTPDGMHSHRDEPLCGGDLALIVYLTDCEGGRVIFEDGDCEELQPGRGVVASWGIRRLHRSEKVRSGEKRFVFVECKL